MSFVRKGVATAVLAAGLLLPLHAQKLPELSMKNGEEKYCTATLKDLNGVNFPGIIRIYHRDESTDFYVMQEHPTYKAPDKKTAYTYGSQRAVMSVYGPIMGDSVADVLTVDNETSFGNEDPKKSQITADKMGFVNDLFACAAKAETVK